MIEYQTAINNSFGATVVDDGYSGDRLIVMLSHVDGYLIEVHAHGCHRGPAPQCLDLAEVIWAAHNRPACKSRYGRIELFDRPFKA